MLFASGMLALALAAAGDSNVPAGSAITSRIRVVEMHGLEWRARAHAGLTPVSRQGNATIWTADSGTALSIAKGAEKVIVSPVARSSIGQQTTIEQGQVRHFVATIDRVADGPVDHASVLAFKPEVEAVRDGFRATVQGRNLDQGVLAKVVLEDTHFLSLHTVAVKESLEKSGAKEDALFLIGQYQVPEVVSSHVEGEWLIPSNGALVVGLGVHTQIDAKGKPELVERVALIETAAGEIKPQSLHPTPGPHPDRLSIQPTPGPYRFDSRFAPEPLDAKVSRASQAGVNRPTAPAPPAPGVVGVAITLSSPTANPTTRKPMPAVPSRSTPQGFAADGTPVPLPPLPDEDAEQTSYEQSAEPRPSPQARNAIKKIVDDAIDRVELLDGVKVFARGVEGNDASCCVVDAAVKRARGATPSPSAPHRQNVVRIGLGGGVVLEVPRYIRIEKEAEQD